MINENFGGMKAARYGRDVAISDFEGAHIAMPEYESKYKTEKNINVVRSGMKNQN